MSTSFFFGGAVPPPNEPDGLLIKLRPGISLTDKLASSLANATAKYLASCPTTYSSVISLSMHDKLHPYANYLRSEATKEIETLLESLIGTGDLMGNVFLKAGDAMAVMHDKGAIPGLATGAKSLSISFTVKEVMQSRTLFLHPAEVHEPDWSTWLGPIIAPAQRTSPTPTEATSTQAQNTDRLDAFDGGQDATVRGRGHTRQSSSVSIVGAGVRGMFDGLMGRMAGTQTVPGVASTTTAQTTTNDARSAATFTAPITTASLLRTRALRKPPSVTSIITIGTTPSCTIQLKNASYALPMGKILIIILAIPAIGKDFVYKQWKGASLGRAGRAFGQQRDDRLVCCVGFEEFFAERFQDQRDAIKLEVGIGDSVMAELMIAPCKLCVVCLTKPRAQVYRSCHHFVACQECTTMLLECPICKKTLTEMDRTHPTIQVGGDQASLRRPAREAVARPENRSTGVAPSSTSRGTPTPATRNAQPARPISAASTAAQRPFTMPPIFGASIPSPFATFQATPSLFDAPAGGTSTADPSAAWNAARRAMLAATVNPNLQSPSLAEWRDTMAAHRVPGLGQSAEEETGARSLPPPIRLGAEASAANRRMLQERASARRLRAQSGIADMDRQQSGATARVRVPAAAVLSQEAARAPSPDFPGGYVARRNEAPTPTASAPSQQIEAPRPLGVHASGRLPGSATVQRPASSVSPASQQAQTASSGQAERVDLATTSTSIWTTPASQSQAGEQSIDPPSTGTTPTSATNLYSGVFSSRSPGLTYPVASPHYVPTSSAFLSSTDRQPLPSRPPSAAFDPALGASAISFVYEPNSHLFSSAATLPLVSPAVPRDRPSENLVLPILAVSTADASHTSNASSGGTSTAASPAQSFASAQSDTDEMMMTLAVPESAVLKHLQRFQDEAFWRLPARSDPPTIQELDNEIEILKGRLSYPSDAPARGFHRVANRQLRTNAEIRAVALEKSALLRMERLGLSHDERDLETERIYSRARTVRSDPPEELSEPRIATMLRLYVTGKRPEDSLIVDLFGDRLIERSDPSEFEASMERSLTSDREMRQSGSLRDDTSLRSSVSMDPPRRPPPLSLLKLRMRHLDCLIRQLDRWLKYSDDDSDELEQRMGIGANFLLRLLHRQNAVMTDYDSLLESEHPLGNWTPRSAIMFGFGLSDASLVELDHAVNAELGSLADRERSVVTAGIIGGLNSPSEDATERECRRALQLWRVGRMKRAVTLEKAAIRMLTSARHLASRREKLGSVQQAEARKFMRMAEALKLSVCGRVTGGERRSTRR